MFETGIRQFQMAWAMIWGKPIHPRTVERLIQDGLHTLQEFGAPGDDVQQLLEGPFSDPLARRDFQNRALQRTFQRLMRTSRYYQKRFASLALDGKNLTVDDMPHIPITLKKDIQEYQQEFVATDSHPFITTRTTGTTGRPAEIWLSKYEIELWPALAALSGLLRNEISPQDCMQINISSRATAAVQQNLTVCRLTGARTRVLGVINPEESLDSLLTGGDEAPTLLSTYPSYLAQLVHAARRRHLGPYDFRLRRIDCGGEVLSAALAHAAQETLGPRLVNDSFGMTEILPVSGRVCSQGHLHHDLNMGFVEVIDLKSDEPAAANALGTVVVTPYYPYRECMPVFRYDTRDVVRRLPDDPLTCDLAGVPATSRILSKVDQLLYVNDHIVTFRDLVELLEALPSEPWPIRFKAQVVNNLLEVTLPECVLNTVSTDEIERRFRASGLPVPLIRVNAHEAEPSFLRPLRADLVETTFAARRD